MVMAEDSAVSTSASPIPLPVFRRITSQYLASWKHHEFGFEESKSAQIFIAKLHVAIVTQLEITKIELKLGLKSQH